MANVNSTNDTAASASTKFTSTPALLGSKIEPAPSMRSRSVVWIVKIADVVLNDTPVAPKLNEPESVAFILVRPHQRRQVQVRRTEVEDTEVEDHVELHLVAGHEPQRLLPPPGQICSTPPRRRTSPGDL